VVKPGSLKLELISDISQAASSRYLGKHHDHKLAPAVQGAVLPPGLEPISLNFGKIM
jgi:hypothetical protein